jgi:hypothetical protein
MLFFACYSSHTTRHTVPLSNCSYSYSSHIVTPFLQSFLSHYFSQVLTSLTPIVLLMPPLLLLSHAIVLFGLVSMVLPPYLCHLQVEAWSFNTNSNTKSKLHFIFIFFDFVFIVGTLFFVVHFFFVLFFVTFYCCCYFLFFSFHFIM